ncbi:MAG TPA: helix-turn-helix domain-containing protein [Pseudonocardiaceae bacterium]|jgi:AcrR family transcriptional regulator|nr:helix-turn-helix domain-containing protein [Pseudonocardiaceae bacterium]
MARRTGEAGGGAWQWSRTAQTRRALLDAAREVFGEQGFTAAGVAAVAERAGSSVGSLYHHFGGKAELFLALWEDHQAAHEAAAAGAVAKARARGETDPLALLITGARAYLDCSWERRDAVRLFADGDAPPGFEVQRRERGREWLRQNATLLGAGTGRTDRLTVAVLTAIIGETAREIATCPTKRAANQLTEHAIGLIRRLDPRNRED